MPYAFNKKNKWKKQKKSATWIKNRSLKPARICSECSFFPFNFRSILAKTKTLSYVQYSDGFNFTWQNTNELKISVFNIRSESGPSRWNVTFPLVWRNHITTNWYIDCPKIFLHITLLIKFPFLPTGGLFINSSLGGSVASASAPRVSIIMLTHRSWTAVRGAFPSNSYMMMGKMRKKVINYCK